MSDNENIWFPDQVEPILDPNDFVSVYQFKEFWKREKDRCLNGFYLADGRVKVPGRLYFHTVYWRISAYVEIEAGGKKKKIKKIITPLLRDIDWDIFWDAERCTDEGRFYDLVGSRDFGKSITAASLAGWQYTFFPKSESVISGGESSFIKLATDKIEDGLLNMHPVFRKQRITSDWKKEIVAGWKDKRTNLPDPKSSMSSIKVRNYENGQKSMAANGTRPGFHLIDEQGTIQHLIACIKDSDGCWWSGGGNKPSCLVMLAGTGGDMEVGAEAGEVFFNPVSYNMLDFDNPEVPGGRMGRFISALRAKMAYKEPKTLAEYLGIDHPELHRITILVSNEERALKEWWEPEHARALASGNHKTVLKFKAYWPLKASDCFLILTKNNYNIEAAKAQQSKILQNGWFGTPVEMYHDGEKITHKHSNKQPITQFPLKDQHKDAPAVIWEFPPENPPFGLYVAGIDPYRQGKAVHSDSLGAVYIFKRMHSLTSEKYQDVFVASYVARPESQEEWNEQARLLIKYYNARALCENDEMSFINYMIYKGDSHYLERQPEWLKEITNTSVSREYGIHRSNERIRTYLRGAMKRYLDATIDQERDAEGSVIRETLGVTRVFDRMLLQEVILFNEDGNFDREIAASLAIALAEHLNPQYIATDAGGDPRLSSYFNTKKKSSARTAIPIRRTSSFAHTRRKIFS